MGDTIDTKPRVPDKEPAKSPTTGKPDEKVESSRQEAAGKVADVASSNGNRTDAANASAEGLVNTGAGKTTTPEKGPDKKAENPKKAEEPLPDNWYSRQYYDLKNKVETGQIDKGPFTNLFLVILRGLAIASKYWDMIPGYFVSSIKEKVEVFDPMEEEKLKANQILKAEELRKRQEEAQKVLAAKALVEKNTGNSPGIEKYSVENLCSVLWGIDTIHDAGTLARKLTHSSTYVSEDEQAIPYYTALTSLSDLKTKLTPEMIGSIIIFVPEVKNGNKIAAYFDGEKFNYFDPADGEVKWFKLNDKEAIINKGASVLMAFIPNKGLEERKQKALADFQEKVKNLERDSKGFADLAKKTGVQFIEIKDRADKIFAEVTDSSQQLDNKVKAMLAYNNVEEIPLYKGLTESIIKSLEFTIESYKKYQKLGKGSLANLETKVAASKKEHEAFEAQLKEAEEVVAQILENNPKDPSLAEKTIARDKLRDQTAAKFKQYEESEANRMSAIDANGVIDQSLEQLNKELAETQKNKQEIAKREKPQSSPSERPPEQSKT